MTTATAALGEYAAAAAINPKSTSIQAPGAAFDAARF
jgi:hypothetical protein